MSCSRRRLSSYCAMGFVCLAFGGGLVRDAYAQERQDPKVALKAVVLDIAPASPHVSGGILIRELVRQAVLLAARDEMGLITRDAALGEVLAAESPLASQPLEIEVAAPGTDGEHSVTVHINRRQPGEKQPQNLSKLTIKVPEGGSLPELIAELEKLTRKDFIATLEHAGYEKVAQPVAKPRDQPTEAEQAPTDKPADRPQGDAPKVEGGPAKFLERVHHQQHQMSPFVQLAAIRALHQEMRHSGETPEQLAALARGYVNLGMLTEFLWSPAHKVFKARGLLYAERMVAKYPSSAASMTRGYARAMVGLPSAGQQDLEAALNNLAEGVLPQESQLIEAFCDGQVERLVQESNRGTHQLLSRFLLLLWFENLELETVRRKYADNILQLEPNNMRALESMLQRNPPLGILRGVSEAAPHRFHRSVHKELAEIADLPANLRELVANSEINDDERISKVAELMQALLSDSEYTDASQQPIVDLGEPALVVAGQLIREINFTHAFRLVAVQKVSLGLSADEIVQALLPLVEGHRLEAFIECFVSDRDASQEALATLGQMPVDTYVESTRDPLIRALSPVNAQLSSTLYALTTSHSDFVVRDLVDRLRRGLGATVPLGGAAVRLYEMSPETTLTVSWAIKQNWEFAKDHAKEWEEAYQDDPGVQDAFAERYVQLNQLDDAARCLERRLKKLADTGAYNRLAALYRAKGDDTAWVKTMVESLKVPSQGLESATTRVALAKYYMKKNDLKAAQVYADDAAESWAAWAMDCAAQCHEQMGDWDRAEEYVRRISQRYQTSAGMWYFWCQRTGHGDLDAAREAVQPYMEQFATSSDAQMRARFALFNYAEEETDKALEILKDIVDNGGHAYFALQAALLAYELGQNELRDQLLETAQREALQRGNLIAHALMDIRNDLRADDPIPFNTKLHDTRMHSLPDGDATRQSYFVGRFLLLRGRKAEALRYLQFAASSPNGLDEVNTWAGVVLGRSGVARQPLRAAEWSGSGNLEQVIGLLRLGYAQIKNRNFDAAEEQFSKAAKLEPELVDVQFAYAVLNRAKNDFPKAVEYLQKCQKQLPQAIDISLALANCHEMLKDYPAAVSDYQQGIKTNPYNGAAYLGLAALLSTCEDDQIRDGKLALEYARKVQDFNDNSTLAQKQTVLATALAETGEFDEALKIAEQLLPTYPKARTAELQEMIKNFKEKKPFRRVFKPDGENP